MHGIRQEMRPTMKCTGAAVVAELLQGSGTHKRTSGGPLAGVQYMARVWTVGPSYSPGGAGQGLGSAHIPGGPQPDSGRPLCVVCAQSCQTNPDSDDHPTHARLR
ncbi:uncharacterized protein ACWYII_020568 isoform 1-T1 [Salvelinus alpinus]